VDGVNKRNLPIPDVRLFRPALPGATLDVEVSTVWAEAIVFVLAFVALDIAALLWATDSRDGNDWHQHPRP
jgi:hypothetical protein